MVNEECDKTFFGNCFALGTTSNHKREGSFISPLEVKRSNMTYWTKLKHFHVMFEGGYWHLMLKNFIKELIVHIVTKREMIANLWDKKSWIWSMWKQCCRMWYSYSQTCWDKKSIVNESPLLMFLHPIVYLEKMVIYM